MNILEKQNFLFLLPQRSNEMKEALRTPILEDLIDLMFNGSILCSTKTLLKYRFNIASTLPMTH